MTRSARLVGTTRPVWLAALAVTLVAGTLGTAGCAGRVGSLGPAPTGAPVTAGPATTPQSPGPVPASSTPVIRPTAAPTTAVPGTGPQPTGPPGPTARTLAVQLWFVRDGRLVPTRHVRPATPATSRLVLDELAAGPAPAELAAGLRTAVPAGLGVTGITDRVATVVVGAGFDADDPAVVRLRRAQVVYSLTQFPTVDRVVFRSTGRPDPPPVGRGDFTGLLPPVVVTAPTIGDVVTSPITVTGSADVFEATVTVRVLDAAGRPVGTAFTTATCGTGCRGDYRVAVGYRLVASQSGLVEVYQVSPEDGSRIDVVSLPVRLTAAPG